MAEPTPTGPGVEIEYCLPCGSLLSAIELSRALLERFGRELAGVRLVPGRGGVFKVRVDGEPIFDKERDRYDLESIARRIAARLDATGYRP